MTLSLKARLYPFRDSLRRTAFEVYMDPEMTARLGTVVTDTKRDGFWATADTTPNQSIFRKSLHDAVQYVVGG